MLKGWPLDHFSLFNLLGLELDFISWCMGMVEPNKLCRCSRSESGCILIEHLHHMRSFIALVHLNNGLLIEFCDKTLFAFVVTCM